MQLSACVCVSDCLQFYYISVQFTTRFDVIALLGGGAAVLQCAKNAYIIHAHRRCDLKYLYTVCMYVCMHVFYFHLTKTIYCSI